MHGDAGPEAPVQSSAHRISHIRYFVEEDIDNAEERHCHVEHTGRDRATRRVRKKRLPASSAMATAWPSLACVTKMWWQH